MEEITFTAEDLELLRQAAVAAATMIHNVGCRFESYQEASYQFAKEWAEGNRWNTPKTRAWARRIEGDLVRMRRRAAGAAEHGESGAKARARG